MMCHSVEAARYLLTEPGAPRTSLVPLRVTAQAACLKWQRPEYAERLARRPGPPLDYRSRPAEDFAAVVVEYSDAAGNPLVVEAITSWAFVGAGLRLRMELLGPEYSMSVSSLETGLALFFSRAVEQQAGEDLVEKQSAESGLMPVVPNEAAAYGYEDEDRHMVRSFLAGERPRETFDDGLAVTELLMAAYMSAEQERTITFPPGGLETFVPAVAARALEPAGLNLAQSCPSASRRAAWSQARAVRAMQVSVPSRHVNAEGEHAPAVVTAGSSVTSLSARGRQSPNP